MEELARLRERDPELASSAVAAGALAMAMELDDPGNSATSKSMCMKALMDAMDHLRALSPVVEEADGLDEIAARRARRLGGAGA